VDEGCGARITSPAIRQRYLVGFELTIENTLVVVEISRPVVGQDLVYNYKLIECNAKRRRATALFIGGSVWAAVSGPASTGGGQFRGLAGNHLLDAPYLYVARSTSAAEVWRWCRRGSEGCSSAHRLAVISIRSRTRGKVATFT
jgi:hypothetical protein